MAWTEDQGETPIIWIMPLWLILTFFLVLGTESPPSTRARSACSDTVGTSLISSSREIFWCEIEDYPIASVFKRRTVIQSCRADPASEPLTKVLRDTGMLYLREVKIGEEDNGNSRGRNKGASSNQLLAWLQERGLEFMVRAQKVLFNFRNRNPL